MHSIICTNQMVSNTFSNVYRSIRTIYLNVQVIIRVAFLLLHRRNHTNTYKIVIIL